MPGDRFGIDLEAFEDRLVEQATFALVGCEVGGLEVLGQGERDVDGGHRLVVGDLELFDQLLGGHGFALDAGHLAAEEVLADAVGEVGVPEPAFFAGQSSVIDAGATDLLAGDSGESSTWARTAEDQFASLARDLDGVVVALDGSFDGVDAVIGLRAGARLASAADEVLVVGALASYAREEKPSAAFGAEEAAA